MVTRRYCLITPPINALQQIHKTMVKPVASNSNAIESDRLYLYETNRFRTMYMLSDDNERCVTIKRRVDWYDAITDEPMSFNEASVYITNAEEF